MDRSASTSSRNRFLLAAALSVAGHGVLIFGADRLIHAPGIPSSLPVLRIGLTMPRTAASRSLPAETPPTTDESASSDPKAPAAEAAPLATSDADPTAAESPADVALAADSITGTEPALASSGPVTADAASQGNTTSGPETLDFDSLAAGRILPLPDYPAMAKRGGIEGTVTLRLHINADGTILEAEVLPPPAHRSLERAVLETVLASWNFPPPGREVVTTKKFAFELTPAR